MFDYKAGECEKTASAGRKSKSSFHCCLPCCNGDSRYHSELIFHHLPGRGSHGEQLKKDWLVKIRRDEGPYFRVCIANILGLTTDKNRTRYRQLKIVYIFVVIL